MVLSSDLGFSRKLQILLRFCESFFWAIRLKMFFCLKRSHHAVLLKVSNNANTSNWNHLRTTHLYFDWQGLKSFWYQTIWVQFTAWKVPKLRRVRGQWKIISLGLDLQSHNLERGIHVLSYFSFFYSLTAQTTSNTEQPSQI